MRKIYAITLFVVALMWSGALCAQSNINDFSITDGPNYSSADRKSTVPAQWLVPGNFSYRPTCWLMLGVDDDSFVSNKAQSGWDSGTGNLGFEAHVRMPIWGPAKAGDGTCTAVSNKSLRVDYIATVPVPGTLESTELGNQIKGTFNLPTPRGDDLLVSVGINILGLSGGGHTEGAIATANYYRAFKDKGLWGWEGEVDLGSATKLGPSSVSVLFAVDGPLNHSQSLSIRFGTAVGVTPYAPKISPFIQFTYLGHFGRKRNVPPADVLY
jgi:hypothetical protein